MIDGRMSMRMIAIFRERERERAREMDPEMDPWNAELMCYWMSDVSLFLRDMLIYLFMNYQVC